jgi:hypothetical protein
MQAPVHSAMLRRQRPQQAAISGQPGGDRPVSWLQSASHPPVQYASCQPFRPRGPGSHTSPSTLPMLEEGSHTPCCSPLPDCRRHFLKAIDALAALRRLAKTDLGGWHFPKCTQTGRHHPCQTPTADGAANPSGSEVVDALGPRPVHLAEEQPMACNIGPQIPSVGQDVHRPSLPPLSQAAHQGTLPVNSPTQAPGLHPMPPVRQRPGSHLL